MLTEVEFPTASDGESLQASPPPSFLDLHFYHQLATPSGLKGLRLMVQFHSGVLMQHGQREGHESYHLEKIEAWTPIVTPASLVSILSLVFNLYNWWFSCNEEVFWGV